MTLQVDFLFEGRYYLVKNYTGLEIKKLYNQSLTQEEENQIINTAIQQVISEIKEKLGK